jgi:hypothetical protein
MNHADYVPSLAWRFHNWCIHHWTINGVFGVPEKVPAHNSVIHLDRRPEPDSKEPADRAENCTPEVLDTMARGQIGPYATMLGLCWIFGLALLPGYIGYHGAHAAVRTQYFNNLSLKLCC